VKQAFFVCVKHSNLFLEPATLTKHRGLEFLLMEITEPLMGWNSQLANYLSATLGHRF